MSDEVNSTKAIAPPFEIKLFHQPITRRAGVVLKEDDSSGIEKEDLAVRIMGSGACPITVGIDNALVDGDKAVDFHPWDLVQLVILVNWTSQFSAIIKTGEFGLKVKDPLRRASFFARRSGKDGVRRPAEIPEHIFELLEGAADCDVYFAAVTFVPDPDLEESYVPHQDSGIVVAEVVNAYVLRLWTVRLVTSGGITRLSVTHKDVARPDGLTGRDKDRVIMDAFVNENSHLFF